MGYGRKMVRKGKVGTTESLGAIGGEKELPKKDLEENSRG